MILPLNGLNVDAMQDEEQTRDKASRCSISGRPLYPRGG